MQAKEKKAVMFAFKHIFKIHICKTAVASVAKIPI